MGCSRSSHHQRSCRPGGSWRSGPWAGAVPACSGNGCTRGSRGSWSCRPPCSTVCAMVKEGSWGGGALGMLRPPQLPGRNQAWRSQDSKHCVKQENGLRLHQPSPRTLLPHTPVHLPLLRHQSLWPVPTTLTVVPSQRWPRKPTALGPKGPTCHIREGHLGTGVTIPLLSGGRGMTAMPNMFSNKTLGQGRPGLRPREARGDSQESHGSLQNGSQTQLPEGTPTPCSLRAAPDGVWE